MTVPIAVFGKGGAGKSTIAANISAALAEAGNRVLLVGCGQTSDSSYLLLSGVPPLSLIDYLDTNGQNDSELLRTGYRGVGCMETGDFHCGAICSSLRVAGALRTLRTLAVVEEFAPEIIIYDMPGDIGCLGPAIFAQLSLQTAIVVTSADFQSLYAANRVIGLLSRQEESPAIALVANGNISSFEDSLVADFAGKVGVGVTASIPRSLVVRHSELYGKTVMEAAPLSSHAYSYRRLARVASNGKPSSVKSSFDPFPAVELKLWAQKWGERLGELEFGLIQDGGGI